MRAVNIVLLVLAGAIGGAVVMKVAQSARPAQFAEVKPPEPAATAVVLLPAAVPAPTVEPPMKTPVVEVETKPLEPKPVEAKPVEPKPVATSPMRHPAAIPPKRVEYPHSVERHKVFPPAPIVLAKIQTPPPAAASTPPLTPEQPKETPPARMEPENATPAPVPIPSTPEPHTVTLNAGLLIPVRLVDGLSLERNHTGDRFAATLDRELVAGGFVIAERGARVEGKVVTADRGAKTLSIELERVETSDRQDVAIQTERFDKRDDPDRGQDAAKVGAGAVIGAVIGGVVGGGKGAAIGAGVGGGAGAGGVMLSRKPVTLPSETKITFRLRAPVTITERRD